MSTFRLCGCHDLTMLYLNPNKFAIISVKGVDYHCIIHDINKSEVIHILEIFVRLMIVNIYKMHLKEISIENRVYNCILTI